MGKSLGGVTVATRRSWLPKSQGTLVKDGDPSAAVLFARKGQKIRVEDLARFPNAAEFFTLPKVEAEPPKKETGQRKP